MILDEKTIKLGVLIGQKPTDYIAGENSPLLPVPLTDGDWRPYKPKHEIQFMNAGFPNAFDTSYCTAFSGTDTIETIFNFHLVKENFSSGDVAWLNDNGYIVDGLVDFSDRFTGIMAGLGPNGGYLYQIAESIRKDGLIPGKMFPNKASSYKEYVNRELVTPEMVELGKQFAKRFPISYEWVSKDKAGDWLKYSPLHCTVRFANADKPEDVLNPVGEHNHAVVEMDRTGTYELINDSYYQEEKRYAPGHPDNFLAYYVRVKKKVMILKKEKSSPHIYLINEEEKTKIMIVDIETLSALEQNKEFSVVPDGELAKYHTNGSLIWVDRIVD